MKAYKLVAGNSGYEVLLTPSQAEHMLSLWGEHYDISDCTLDNSICSPSGYSSIELVYQEAEVYAG